MQLVWDKVEYKDRVEENVKHDDVRHQINFLRWDMSNFDDVVLYTTKNADEIIDELISLMKFSNIYAVFNYGTDNEYKVEL